MLEEVVSQHRGNATEFVGLRPIAFERGTLRGTKGRGQLEGAPLIPRGITRMRRRPVPHPDRVFEECCPALPCEPCAHLAHDSMVAMPVPTPRSDDRGVGRDPGRESGENFVRDLIRVSIRKGQFVNGRVSIQFPYRLP
jgi:hypothetical protein